MVKQSTNRYYDTVNVAAAVLLLHAVLSLNEISTWTIAGLTRSTGPTAFGVFTSFFTKADSKYPVRLTNWRAGDSITSKSWITVTLKHVTSCFTDCVRTTLVVVIAVKLTIGTTTHF